MPKVAATRPKRSKPEIQREFARITEEADEEREAANPKADELAKARDREIRQAVGAISVEGVVQKVSNLGLDISKSLADLSEKLVVEVEQLARVREAVALETKELERLHKVDIAATSLDQLIQDYRSQETQLETEIASQRAAWADEERTRAASQKEYEDNLKKQRQREIEEYEYKKSLERKKAQDKYDEDIRLLEKKNAERQETLEKSWQEREGLLKEKEGEWGGLRKEVDEFPVRLKKEIDRAVSEAVKTEERRFEQQLILLRKDSEADKRIADLQIHSLEDTAKRQSVEIELLRKQLDDAKKQVQDIAVKAIEGASGASALNHINQIAMEQAKTRAPQG